MAKKVKPQQQPLSPEKYIRLKARTLPIVKCYINGNWEEVGMASIIVVRQHQSGNYTSAQYLVDIYCLGIKNTTYCFNFSPEQLDEMTDGIPYCEEISYNEVHNIIFGAITFAEEEVDMLPHKDFELTRYMLEEDTDDIPLIEYEFGRFGTPLLVVNTRFEASRYLPKLQKKYGESFPYLIREEEKDEYEDEYEDEYDEYEDIDDEEEDDNDIFKNLDPAAAKEMLRGLEKMKSNITKVEGMTHTTYAYVHPEYPSKLNLTHPELIDILYEPEYFKTIPPYITKELLDLPRESLIADLHLIILFELGQACDTITEEMYDMGNNSITHALFLLGELKATESLQTVLEILRQNEEATNYHFGDAHTNALRLTLYYIGRNQTEALLTFMKEPGLWCFNRIAVPIAMTTIAINEPERREEVIDWYKQLLHFLIENLSDSSVYDATLCGSIMSELINIHATELLPEIEALYATKQVDFMCCGHYPEVKEDILSNSKPLENYSLMDINQRYENYEQEWGG